MLKTCHLKTTTAFHLSHTKCLVKENRKVTVCCFVLDQRNSGSSRHLTDTRVHEAMQPFQTVTVPLSMNKDSQQQPFNNPKCPYQAGNHSLFLHAIQSTLCDADRSAGHQQLQQQSTSQLSLNRGTWWTTERASGTAWLPSHLLSIQFHMHTYIQHCTTNTSYCSCVSVTASGGFQYEQVHTMQDSKSMTSSKRCIPKIIVSKANENPQQGA